MNDQEVARLLERVAGDVQVGPAPVQHLLGTGRRAIRRRRLRALAGVAAGAAVVAGGVAGGVVAWGPTPEPRPPVTAPSAAELETLTPGPTGPTGPLIDNGVADCVEEYRPDAVGRRGFAFDGVVTKIGASVTGGMPVGQPQVLVGVTFDVREWFAGGHGATITVDMLAPAVTGSGSTVNAPSYGVGTRLLVSGESRWGGPPLKDPIAWSCGFTRYWDPDTAASWRR